MFTKRIAALALASAALVPVLGAPAADASIPPIRPAELCHPKWILPPSTGTIYHQQQGGNSSNPFDVENQTSDGSDPNGWETVANDDLTYDGC